MLPSGSRPGKAYKMKRVVDLICLIANSAGENAPHRKANFCARQLVLSFFHSCFTHLPGSCVDMAIIASINVSNASSDMARNIGVAR